MSIEEELHADRDDPAVTTAIWTASGAWSPGSRRRSSRRTASGPSTSRSSCEEADAVGLSILSGAHMTLVPRVVELLKEQGIDDVLVTVGGTIPSDDIPHLKE